MSGSKHFTAGITGRVTARVRGRALALAATALVVAACGGRQEPERAAVEYKGTNPSAAGTAAAAQPAAPSGPSGGAGIVSYEGYQAAVARKGDTVADVAQRLGVSATELGAYNGLPADHQLRGGDELVLPPKPGGYGPGGTDGTQVAQAGTAGTTGGFSGDTSGGFESSSIESAPIESAPIESAPIESAPMGEQAPTGPGQWSLASAEAAIERAAGFDEEGNPGAPPSSDSPLPPDPEQPGELDSPQLSQYQTPQPEVETPQPPAPRPVEEITTPAEEPAGEPAPQETEVAAATPAAPSSLSLIRPVSGPVVVGFGQGSGRARNDGIDFASPVGSPVVAAADGEVALVSQSLGGLGTIVLLRHPGDYLTVYGRVDRVSVAKGDIVSQGQQIGVVASNPQPRMHFEVRKGAESLNPERFLSGAS